MRRLFRRVALRSECISGCGCASCGGDVMGDVDSVAPRQCGPLGECDAC